MSEFTRSVKKAFSGAMKSFNDFPVTILCGFGFLLVTMVRIQMDWATQQPYNFLFNCLHLSFAFGAVFSLMLTTFAHSRINTKKAFWIGNIISLVSVIFIFVILFFFSKVDISYNMSQYQQISPLAIARVLVGMFVSYLVFILLSGSTYDKKEIDVAKHDIFSINFPRALFMSHKAVFIALIYGIVIILGASGVAGAIQGLLYQNMSEKVYMYIGGITGFIVFTIFVGYFPDFRKGVEDPQRETAEAQPRFVEVLFAYIMVPLMIALTLVILLWTGKQVITGVDVSFEALTSIAAAYTIGGIWLHMMVSEHDAKLTKFYRHMYPVSALIILVFEASVLIKQLGESGLKFTEYWFILLWIGAVAAAILLIILKSKAYILIVAVTCILAITSVLPYVGYNALPVRAQINRLETLLISENMLQDGAIVPATEEPEHEVRAAITDSIDYLAYANDAKLPSWFDEKVTYDYTFKEVFGFNKTWPKDDGVEQPLEYKSISLYLPATSIDISDYNLAINVVDYYEKGQGPINLEGEQGTYKIIWNSYYDSRIPSIEIQLNDEAIIYEDMSKFIDNIINEYSYENMGTRPGNVEDMTMVLESKEVRVLLVVGGLDISMDLNNDSNYYMINLDAIYIYEKN